MALTTSKSQLPQDQAGKAVQAGHTIVCHDGHGTTNVSPKAVAGTAIAITAPANAIRLWVSCDTEDLLFGENATLDGSAIDKGYCTLKKDLNPTAIPITKAGTIIYFVQSATGGNLHFFFELIDG